MNDVYAIDFPPPKKKHDKVTVTKLSTYLSSFFVSRGGAGPLAWPRGSNAEPTN